VKLSRIAGVSAAGARRRNPSIARELPITLSSPNQIVILSEAKDLCNESC